MASESSVVVERSPNPQGLAGNSPKQLEIDYTAARRLAETGMERTLAAESDEWLRRALDALRRFVIAPGWHEFKLEDFRAWYIAEGGEVPHDHHVWGALANRASRAGVIRWTGRFANSVSPKTHGHPVRVWAAT